MKLRFHNLAAHARRLTSCSFFSGFCGCLLVLLMLSLPATGQRNDTGSNTDKNVSQMYDTSTWLELLAAVEGGGGLSSSSPAAQATANGGIKLGFPVHFGKFDPAKPDYTFTLDMGYDRLQSRNGFATEASTMLPVWRYPKPQSDESKNFLRVYAEPGVGYRAGSGPFGGYASAKVMIALFSDNRLNFSSASPFLEVQRRFPFDAPMQGDTRVAVGIMIALCNHCGLD